MSDVVADIERAIGGYEEGAWVPESHATIEHISLMRRAASELALLRRAFDRAEQRMTRGLSPRRLSFRCSHCAKVTPLLLDGLIQALRDAEAELIKEQDT
jgi:hypothetical protein